MAEPQKKSLAITISHQERIFATPEAVWDFTQDYARRTLWDRTIAAAEVLSRGGPPVVRVRFVGGMQCTFRYKVFDRPIRTSLAIVDVSPAWFRSGGGAWRYERIDELTAWTQTNTVIFGNRFAHWLFASLTRRWLQHETRRAMQSAKRMIEGGRASP